MMIMMVLCARMYKKTEKKYYFSSCCTIRKEEMEAPSWKKESFCTILEGQPIDDDINSVDDPAS